MPKNKTKLLQNKLHVLLIVKYVLQIIYIAQLEYIKLFFATASFSLPSVRLLTHNSLFHFYVYKADMRNPHSLLSRERRLLRNLFFVQNGFLKNQTLIRNRTIYSI